MGGVSNIWVGYFISLEVSFPIAILLVQSLAAGNQAAFQEVDLDPEEGQILEVVAHLGEGILAVEER